MFKSKNGDKKLWITLVLLFVLVAIMILLQTQVIAMLRDLQTNVFGDYIRLSNYLTQPGEWVMDSNPLPPARF